MMPEQGHGCLFTPSHRLISSLLQTLSAVETLGAGLGSGLRELHPSPAASMSELQAQAGNT